MVASVSAGSGHITNHNQDGAQGMVPITTGSLPRAHAYFDFKQSESFPTILRSKLMFHSSRKNIILVHGFRSTTPEEFDYQTALESCVKDVVARAEDGSYQVRPFRFHACDMLAGGEDTFTKTKLKLVSKLLKLQSQFADFGESASDNQSSAAAPSSSFIFVAHGVGSLLVKSVLEMDAGRAIARNSLGLIFLDSPRECTQIQGISEYLAVVNGPRETLSINTGDMERSPSSPSLTLASRLIQAGDTSPKYLGGHLKPTFINVGWPDSSPEIPRPVKVSETPDSSSYPTLAFNSSHGSSIINSQSFSLPSSA
jgi:hypothetical protein